MRQVKSLLDLESAVRTAVDGLKPIQKDRLKSEAQTFGWAAVRAHALEWFDSLPARAFETHSLAPMSLSLWPKRGEAADFTVIKQANLHTTSPLVHEWALHHRSCASVLCCSILHLKPFQSPGRGRSSHTRCDVQQLRQLVWRHVF